MRGVRRTMLGELGIQDLMQQAAIYAQTALCKSKWARLAGPKRCAIRPIPPFFARRAGEKRFPHIGLRKRRRWLSSSQSSNPNPHMKPIRPLLCLLLLSLPALTSQAAEKAFRAGASAVDITPAKWPVSLVGSFSDRQATKAWDPLHARALVLENGETRLAIVVVDNCLIKRPLLDEAKRRAAQRASIPADRILVSATHTHSAPASKTWSAIGTKASPEYLEQLTEGIADSVKRAEANLEPARIGFGAAYLPQHVFNRRWHVAPKAKRMNPFGRTDDIVVMNPSRSKGLLRIPAGPTDPDLSFVSVQAKDGRPIALLANYSLHYVGGVPAGGVSADYFGEFARQIARRLNAPIDGRKPFVGIMSNGTSGDINNINFFDPKPRKDPFVQIKNVASDCADAVIRQHEFIEFKDWVPLKMQQRELTLKLRKPTPDVLANARKFQAAPSDKGLPPRAKAYADWAIRLHEGPATEDIILQAIRIGDLGITSIPCETFVEIGLDIKARSPLHHTFTIELANGHYGYLPTPRQHRLGGYETWLGSCTLEINASEKIADTLLAMLADLAK